MVTCMNFKIIGNRAYIRSDEEMAFIDKNRADSAFKKYKKEIIDSYMKEQGFKKNDMVLEHSL